MSDLISRQAAIDVLEERLQANGYSNVALVSELNRSIGYLMRLPSVEAEPVRHGRWLDGNMLQSCSACRYRGKKSWNYCPNCGAKMDGEQE